MDFLQVQPSSNAWPTIELVASEIGLSMTAILAFVKAGCLRVHEVPGREVVSRADADVFRNGIMLGRERLRSQYA